MLQVSVVALRVGSCSCCRHPYSLAFTSNPPLAAMSLSAKEEKIGIMGAPLPTVLIIPFRVLVIPFRVVVSFRIRIVVCGRVGDERR